MATIVDTSTVKISDVSAKIFRDAPRLLNEEPYSYYVSGAFARQQGHIEEEPPEIGYSFQTTLNPAEMGWLVREFGVDHYLGCCGKTFHVNPDWKVFDSGVAFKRFLEEIVPRIHILDVKYNAYAEYDACPEAIDGLYKLKLSFVPQIQLDRIGYIQRAIFGCSPMSTITLTPSEFNTLRGIVWMADSPAKNLVGLSFQVNPKWHANTPGEALRSMLRDCSFTKTTAT